MRCFGYARIYFRGIDLIATIGISYEAVTFATAKRLSAVHLRCQEANSGKGPVFL